MRGAKGVGSPNESMIARGRAVKRDIEQRRLLRKAPGDEADAEGSGELSELRGLLLQPASVAIAAAENAEPAGGADRRGETRAGDHIHRRRAGSDAGCPNGRFSGVEIGMSIP